MLGRQTGTRPTDGKRHWLRATNIFDAEEERRAGGVERRRGKGPVGLRSERGGIRRSGYSNSCGAPLEI